MPTSQAARSRAAADQPFAADDLSAIRLLDLPELGPPFDDDPAAASAAAATVASGYGATRPGTRTEAAGQGVPEAGPDGEWARQFARLLTEALSGARPVRQILPWTSERARLQLRALMPLFAGGQRPRLLRVIATRPARDVIEMTVIAGLGARTRAVAVRLQRADPADRPAWLGTAEAFRWLCTDIEAA